MCPPLAASAQVHSSQGHPFSLNHLSTSMCPPLAARRQACESQGAPFSLAHLSASMWPPSAARAQVRQSQGQPFSRARLRASRCPPPAACAQVRSSQGQSLSPSHSSASTCPPFAASAQVFAPQGHPFSLAHLITSRWPSLAAALQQRAAPLGEGGGGTSSLQSRQTKGTTVRAELPGGMRRSTWLHTSYRCDPSPSMRRLPCLRFFPCRRYAVEGLREGETQGRCRMTFDSGCRTCGEGWRRAALAVSDTETHGKRREGQGKGWSGVKKEKKTRVDSLKWRLFLLKTFCRMAHVFFPPPLPFTLPSVAAPRVPFPLPEGEHAQPTRNHSHLPT